MEIISAILPCLCECLSRQCNYLLHHEENTSTLEGKVAALEAQRKDVQVLVDSATSALKDIKYEVQEWLKSADELLKEEANQGCCLNCCSRYKLSRKAVRMASQIDILIERRQRFGTDVCQPPQVRKRVFGTASEKTFQMFSSTKKALEKVWNDLKDASIVGVHGMGGVGKTTIVTHLGATALKDKLFDHVVMVTVSQTVNLINIQNELARGLGLTFENEDAEDDRSEKLRRKLIQEKNVLIILDDLWRPIDLSKVGIDVGVLETSNSKILLTTRKKDVCNRMDSRETNLDQLSEADSWSFFENIVGKISNDTSKFKSIRKKVAEECGGLPLVLQTIAKTLRTKDLKVWTTALHRLKQSRPANNYNDEETTTFLRLKLSYDWLERCQARYFLLCCLFPEDHNISKEELASYGVGLNLFENKTITMEEARGESVLIADDLIESGLLLKGNVAGHVKMHDVMRDMAIRITTPSKEAQTASSSSDVNEFFLINADAILKVDANYTGISLMSNELRSLPDALDCPTLQILLLQDSERILRAIPSTFFATMNALKVLKLDGLQATSLPSSFESLGNIRILYLDYSKLKDVSILGRLKNLEVLSLRISLNIEALSEDLGQLSNLRLLDITWCRNIKTIPSKLLSSLKSLEELYMEGSFADWELVDGANTTIEGRKASFGELINLPCLTVLQVDISDERCIPSLESQPLPKWRKFNISVCGSSELDILINSRFNTKFSRNLVLDLSMKELPRWFLRLLSERSVDSLIYKGNLEVLNILEEYDLGHLYNLMSLSILNMRQEAPLMSTNSPRKNPVFEGLEKLCFKGIDLMEKICVGELPIGSLAKLSSLEVCHCYALVSSLLSSNLIERLATLKVLKVYRNIGVTEVFGFEGLQEGQSYLTNLKKLKLSSLANLVKIWKGSAGFATFTNLKLLTVFNCDKITHLFSVSMSQSLQQLEEIWVGTCPAMKEVIENDQANSGTANVELPKLKKLYLRDLPQLSTFYVLNANLKCPSLEHLHVENCPLFTTATADFHSSNQVQENNKQHFNLLWKRMRE